MAAESDRLAGLAGGEAGERYRLIRHVTLVGSALDLALGIAKIIGGWLASSQSLIADGIHSLSDLGTDVLVIYAAKHAHSEADEEHPYGHGRIETAATVGLGVALVLVAGGIALDAGRDLFHAENLVVPAAWALGVAAVSVVSKEWIYHYTMRYARRLGSGLLRANAWHSRSDAASSVVVIIGVGGALMGLPYLDAIAAVVVAWMIARIGYRLAKDALQELIDTGLQPEQLEAIREAIFSVDGVGDLHQLRTRQMAGRAFVDVHIILDDPRLSVSEGHQISETVRGRLIRRIPDVDDVTVHIDPEDDEEAPRGTHLGLRGQVMRRLEQDWADIPAAAQIRRVNLHYLDGRIHVEVELPLSLLERERPERLQSRFHDAIAGDPDIADVRLLYS